MMISPESYYEMCIKGKSKEAIAKEIDSLKQEISRLKRQIKNPSLNPEDLIFPTPRTQLKCNRNILPEPSLLMKQPAESIFPKRRSKKLTKLMRRSKTMSQIKIKKVSITNAGTECIVNAANENLQGGTGVCGAIFKAAGWNQLQKAYNAIGHCDTESR